MVLNSETVVSPVIVYYPRVSKNRVIKRRKGVFNQGPQSLENTWNISWLVWFTGKYVEWLFNVLPG